MKISFVGNCQVAGLAACAQTMLPDAQVGCVHVGIDSTEPARGNDFIFIQTNLSELVQRNDLWGEPSQFQLIPTFYYPAFHPDLIYAKQGESQLQSPLGDYNSALVLYGWMKGLSVSDTIRLFCEPVFEHLGYFSYYEASRKALIDDGLRTNVDVESLFLEWARRGCFAHSVNHPKLYVLSSIVANLFRQLGIPIATTRPEDFLHDNLADSAVWPVYPEIASRLGIAGDYEFKLPLHLCKAGRTIEVLDLPEFVQRSFACYSSIENKNILVNRFIDQADAYQNLESIASKSSIGRSNPYLNLPDYCFWRKAVGEVAAADLDPVVDPKFTISEHDKISTAGSCFAQHIAKTLVKSGRNFFVAEPAPADMSIEDAGNRGYGLFSARFGNIYSARQLLQLFQRAYGEFTPIDTGWVRHDGKLIDPFRPQIEPSGYETIETLLSDRAEHFGAVRRMFEQSDVFIFTLGLTEAWISKADGAVFPVAPGVVSKARGREGYQFINFNTSDVIDDLTKFIFKIREVNKNIRLILTVSPVPLVATYENRHVLVSTTYSKSALRAAADEVIRKYDFVEYFPSYEIITSWHNKGQYFDVDFRTVAPVGVSHVMNVFSSHYFQSKVRESGTEQLPSQPIQREIAANAKIICDEELVSR
jgi:hypothetical protein